MNLLIILIIIIILVVIYYLSNKTTNDGDTDIYQINKFDNKIYKKYLTYNKPIVITNYLIEFPSFEVLCLEVLKNIDINIITKKKDRLAFKKTEFKNLAEYIKSINSTDYVIYNNYSYFKHFTYEKLLENYKTLTDSLNPKYSLNILPLNFNTPITKNLNNKLIYLIYDGKITINLLNPYNMNNKKLNDSKYLKLDDSYIIFDNENKLELEPVQILCSPGKIIFIPKNWWYYIVTIEPSVLVKLN